MKRMCGNCQHWDPSKPEPVICKKCSKCDEDRPLFKARKKVAC